MWMWRRNSSAPNAPVVGAPVRGVPGHQANTPGTSCFTIDPATIDPQIPEPALISVGGAWKHGTNLPQQIRDKTQAQVDDAVAQAVHVERDLNEKKRKAEDAWGQLADTGADVKKNVKKGLVIAGGCVTTVVAATRLCTVLKQLKYGPEIEQQAKDILTRVKTLLTVRDEFPPKLCDILERIEEQDMKLIEDIHKHYQISNGFRAAGAAAGVAGGVCAVASCFVKGADKASKLGYAAGALVAGEVGTEVVTGVADWFADHQQRLRALSTELDAVKDAAALVRVPPANVVSSREEARTDANDAAGSLLDVVRTLKASN